MSIKTITERAKKNARDDYERRLVKILAAEHDAMNDMLDTLRAGGTMTAAQLAVACNSDISKYEVAGNLLAMATGHSRFEGADWAYGQAIPHVRIPEKREGEYITVRGGGKRKATFAEIDEKGNVIPDTERTMTVYAPKRYTIRQAAK